MAATADRMSNVFFRCSFWSDISALPRSQGFVDTTIWVIGSLGARQFLLHSRHPGTEGFLTRTAFRLRSLESRLAGVSPVVGSPAFGV